MQARRTKGGKRVAQRALLIALVTTLAVGVGSCRFLGCGPDDDDLSPKGIAERGPNNESADDVPEEAGVLRYTGSWTPETSSATTLPYFGLEMLNRTPIFVSGKDRGAPMLTARKDETGTTPADDNGTTREYKNTWTLSATIGTDGAVSGTLKYTGFHTMSNAEYGKYSEVSEDLTATVTGTLSEDELVLTAKGGGPMVQVGLETATGFRPAVDETTDKSFTWTFTGTPG